MKDVILKPENCDIPSFRYLKGIRDNIVEFVERGENLFIFSRVTGNGKTSWALKLLRSYLLDISMTSDLTCKALFINVPQFLITLKESISKKSDYIDYIKENINNVDLVVWDDIGTKSMTEYEAEHLLAMINTRIDNGKTNIYTANVEPTKLEEVVGARLASRISGSLQVGFSGNDRRINH